MKSYNIELSEPWEHCRMYLPMMESQLDYIAAITPSIMKFMQKTSAAAGQLNCTQCTQKLTTADVDAGFCSKCEAPVI